MSEMCNPVASSKISLCASKRTVVNVAVVWYSDTQDSYDVVW